MFIFGPQHSWQGNSDIQQVLVFPNQEIKNKFDKLFDEDVKTNSLEHSDDAGKGAIYKIKAIRAEAGNHIASIRCGVTGKLLWQDHALYFTPSAAIIAAGAKLFQDIRQSFSSFATRYDEIDQTLR